ncbi:MAG: hypothetical protein VB858_19980 [Planctomycetaceae bacterium]
MNQDTVKVTVNRPLVGIISLCCLIPWGYLMLRYPQAEGDLKMFMGALLRVGLLMGAFWYALPTKNRPAAWAQVSPRTFVAMLAAVIGIVARPRIFVPLLGVLAVVGFFLRPRPKPRDERPDREWKQS